MAFECAPLWPSRAQGCVLYALLVRDVEAESAGVCPLVDISIEGKSRSMVWRRSAEVGIELLSLPSFRRGFATASLRNGVDVYGLQRFMGHSDLRVLRWHLMQTDAYGR